MFVGILIQIYRNTHFMMTLIANNLCLCLQSAGSTYVSTNVFDNIGPNERSLAKLKDYSKGYKKFDVTRVEDKYGY